MVRVPTIAYWPGVIEAGRESNHVAGFQDIMSTFAELAGVDCPSNDGISMAPTLWGNGEQQQHVHRDDHAAGPALDLRQPVHRCQALHHEDPGHRDREADPEPSQTSLRRFEFRLLLRHGAQVRLSQGRIGFQDNRSCRNDV